MATDNTINQTEAANNASAIHESDVEQAHLTQSGSPVQVQVPQGENVVRVQVTPGETVELPFPADGLVARLGDNGNLAVKVGDVTVILVGYADAVGQGEVNIVGNDGKPVDVAAVLAATDPNLDIQTAAGPGAGDQGAGPDNNGGLFSPFDPQAGIGGLNAVGGLNPTALNYNLVEREFVELIEADEVDTSPVIVSIRPGNPVNEDDLTGGEGNESLQAAKEYDDFPSHVLDGLSDSLGGLGSSYWGHPNGQGNDPFDTNDHEDGSQQPGLDDNNNGIDQDREPTTTTAVISVDFFGDVPGHLTFVNGGSTPIIDQLQAMNLTSHSNELQYLVLPGSPDTDPDPNIDNSYGETLVAYYVETYTYGEETYEYATVVFTIGLREYDGSVNPVDFNMDFTIYGVIDNIPGVNDADGDISDIFDLNVPFFAVDSDGSVTGVPDGALVFQDIDDVPALGSLCYDWVDLNDNGEGPGEEGPNWAYVPVTVHPTDTSIVHDETDGVQGGVGGQPGDPDSDQETTAENDVPLTYDYPWGSYPNEGVADAMEAAGWSGLPPIGAAQTWLNVSFGADGKAGNWQEGEEGGWQYVGNKEAGETVFTGDGNANATAYQLYVGSADAPLTAGATNWTVTIDGVEVTVRAIQIDANTIIGVANPGDVDGDGELDNQGGDQAIAVQDVAENGDVPVFVLHLDPSSGELTMVQLHQINQGDPTNADDMTPPLVVFSEGEAGGIVLEDNFDTLDAWTVLGSGNAEIVGHIGTIGGQPDPDNQALLIASGEGGESGSSAGDIESFFGLSSGALAALVDDGDPSNDNMNDGDPSDDSEEPTDGTAIKQIVNVTAGDTLTVKFNFLENESDGGEGGTSPFYQDFAFIVVGGEVFLLSDVSLANNGSGASNGFFSWDEESGYLTFTYTFTTDGPTQIGFGVMNEDDDEVDPGLLIDHMTIVHEDTNPESINFRGTDYDGDHVDAPLVVRVQDDGPTVECNALVQLDDDALANGNPGGVGDVAPDTAYLTGTLSHNYGTDVPGTTLLTGATFPNGMGLTSAVSNGGTTLIISQNGVEVLKVELSDTESGLYTVTQLAAIKHVDGDDENNLDITINYQVKDVDNDTANGTLKINVDDDTPVFVDCHCDNLLVNGSFESPDVNSGNYGIFKNIDGWSSSSGDGIEIQDHAAGNPQNGQQLMELDSNNNSNAYQDVATQDGNLYDLSVWYTPRIGDTSTDGIEVWFDGKLIATLDGNGQTPGQWVKFTYQVQAGEGDGTPDLSRLEFRAVGKSDSLGGYIDNVSLCKVNTLNEDDLANGSDFSKESLTVSGATGVKFGADGPAENAFSNLSLGNALTSMGFAVTLGQPDANGVAMATSSDGRDVFKVEFTKTDGKYDGNFKLTLIDQLDHPAGNGENTTDIVVNFTATDSDNDSVNGHLSVTVIDDLPCAWISECHTDNVTIDETKWLQNDDNWNHLAPQAFKDLGSIIAWGESGNPVVTFGGDANADEPASIVLTLKTTNGTDSGITNLNGDAILLYNEGDLVVGRVGGPAGPVAFALSIDQDGEVSVAQYIPLKHPDTNDNDEGISLNDGALQAVVTVTDFDQDVASKSVDIGSKVTFEDDGPKVQCVEYTSYFKFFGHDVGYGSDVAIVDEDWINKGNQDADGSWPTNSDLVGLSYATGKVNVDFGADGNGGFAIKLLAQDMSAGVLRSSDNAPVFLHQNSAGEVVGYVGGDPSDPANIVFKLTLDTNTGDFRFDLYQALEHGHPGNENNDNANDIDLGFTIGAKDGDGDEVTAGIVVRVDDDSPDGFEVKFYNKQGDDNEVKESGIASDSGDDTTFYLDFGFFGGVGADQPGTTTLSLDTAITNLAGEAIVLVDNGAGGYNGVNVNNPGDVYFTVTKNGNGSFTFDMVQSIKHDNPGSDNKTVNFTATVTDSDGDSSCDSFSIKIKDDVPSDIEVRGNNAKVDEDFLTTATNFANGQQDNDTNPDNGENAASNGDGPNGTTAGGSLAVNFGADGGSLSLTSVSVKNSKGDTVNLSNLTTADGVKVDVTVSNGQIVGVRHDNPNVKVFELVLTPTAGGADWAFTLYQALKHPFNDANNQNNGPETRYEDNLNFEFGVKATDGDGDTKTATIKVTVDDDAPTACCVEGDIDEPSQTAIVDAGHVTVNPGNYPAQSGLIEIRVSVPGDAGATLNENENLPGVPGFGITSSVDGGSGSRYNEINYLGNGEAGDTTSEVMIFELQNNAGEAAEGKWATSADVEINVFYSTEGTVGNEVGSYSLYKDGVLVAGPTNFVATSTSGNFNLHIDGPAGGFDEIRFAALPGTTDGNGNNAGDSSDYNVKQVTLNLVEEVLLPTEIAGTICADFGADGAGDIAFITTGDSGYDHNGVSIINSLADGGNTIIGKAGDEVIWKITLNDQTKEYDFELYGKIDGNEDAVLHFDTKVTDADGDYVNGCVTITVDSNDVPTLTIGYDQELQTNTGLVDEDFVGGGNQDLPAPSVGDDIGSTSASCSGTYNADFLGDAPGTVALAAGEGSDTGVNNLAGGNILWHVVSATSIVGYLEGTDPTDPANQYFTLTLSGLNPSNDGDGTWTFTLLKPLQHSSVDTEDNLGLSVPVLATDSNNDHASAFINIQIDDDLPVAVDDGLTAVPSFSQGGGAELVVAAPGLLANDDLGADGGKITSVTFDGQEHNLTNGSVTVSTPHGDLTVNEDGSWSFNQTSQDVDPHTYNFSYKVTDGDGDTDSADFSISMHQEADIAPINYNDANSGDENGAQQNNVMIILDRSGSMDDVVGGNGETRLDLAKAAIQNLLNKYDQLGDVKVLIVQFASDGQRMDFWGTPAEAMNYINNNDPAGQYTSYEDAVSFGGAGLADNDGKIPGAPTTVYFLSDGTPTIDGDGGNNNSLTNAQKTAWDNALESNGVTKVYAVGVGPGLNALDQDLIDVANPDGNNNPVSEVIIVTNENDLAAELESTIGAGDITGNVLTGVDTSGVGDNGVVDTTPDANGNGANHIYTLSHDGNGSAFDVAFSWDGVSANALSVGGAGTNVSIVGHVVSFDTEFGRMVFNMETGGYTFTPGSVTQTQNVVFHYGTKDADGDTDQADAAGGDGDDDQVGTTIPGGADLVITINNVVAPPIAENGNSSGHWKSLIQVNLSGTDPDGSVTGYKLTSLPGIGTLYTDAAGTIPALIGTIYANNVFYFKADETDPVNNSFQFTVIDNEGNEDATPATQTLTLTNTKPTAGNDNVITLNDQTTIPEWALLRNDSDANGDSIDVTDVQNASSGSATHTPGSGSAGNVLFDDDNSGTSGGNNGSFTYQATDGHLDSDAATVTIDRQTGDNVSGGNSAEIIVGNGNGNNLDGNGGDDTILGGAGNDFIEGGSGTDWLFGESGHDTLLYDGSDKFDGGTGNDTLRLEQDVDVNAGFVSRMTSIEVIDLALSNGDLGDGDANSANRLSVQDVVDITDNANGGLFVVGSSNDEVWLNGGQWSAAAGINNNTANDGIPDGNYSHYTGTFNGQTVHLYVDTDVTVHNG
jgi:T1SS-143 domain-containing protein